MIKLIEYLVEHKKKFECWYSLTLWCSCVEVYKDVFTPVIIAKSDSDHAEQYQVFQNGIELGYKNLDEIKEYLKLGEQ